jgi:tetratricopeptide (TPR) repeat protein
MVAHDLVLISSNAGINLYAGNNEKSNGAFPKLPIVEEIEGMDGWNNFDYTRIVRHVGLLHGREMKHSEVSAYFVKKAIDYMRKNPERILKLTAIKTALFWGPVTVSNNMEIHFEKLNSPTLRYIPGFPVAISVAIVGLIQFLLGWKRHRDQSGSNLSVIHRQFEISILILFFIAVYFISFLPFFVVERFRVPVMPFLFLFGAYGLYRIGQLLASRSFYKAVYWTTLCALLYIAASRPIASYTPDLPRWHFLRGNAYEYAGQFDAATKEFRQAILLRPNYMEACYNLGRILVALGRPDEAIYQYSKALKVRPTSAKVHNNLGFVLAAKGKLDEAISHYSEALQTRHNYAKAHNNLGVALARQEKTAQALKHFSEALRIRPDFVEAQANYKTAMAAQEKLDRAIAKFHQAIRINSDDPALHYRLGSLYQRRGNLDEAIRQYKQALSVQPGFVQALNNLAVVYTIQREYEKAISVFEKILELRPDNGSSAYNIACIYARQYRTAESIDWLKKAIDSGYRNWDLIKTDKDLENIRGSAYYKALVRGR